MDPILIDECLTPELAGVAQARGHLAFHVTWLNLAGHADWSVAAVAAERGFIIVTNNRRDYLRIYAAMDVHNGLIVIVPAVAVEDQRRLFAIALHVAERQQSLVNLLIEVNVDGHIETRDWSRDGGVVAP